MEVIDHLAVTIEPMEVQIGNVTLSVRPGDGRIEQGKILVSSLNVEILGEQHFTTSDETEWTEQAIKEQVRSNWMNEEDLVEWPDTSDRSWDEPRLITPDTIKWDVLKYVAENYPCVTQSINDALGLDDSASTYVSRLKDDKLLACIGYESRSQILVPTHVAMKELSTVGGVELQQISTQEQAGLDTLFDKTSDGLDS